MSRFTLLSATSLVSLFLMSHAPAQETAPPAAAPPQTSAPEATVPEQQELARAETTSAVSLPPSDTFLSEMKVYPAF